MAARAQYGLEVRRRSKWRRMVPRPRKGRVNGVCREDKKGKRGDWGGCGGEEVWRPIPAMVRMAAGKEMRN